MAESDLLATQDINSVISTDSAEDAVNDKVITTSTYLDHKLMCDVESLLWLL